MDFYERVRRLAKRKNHPSLQEFIIGLGLNHDTYYGQKRAGNLPRVEDALQIAIALETTVEYLVSGNIPKPITPDEVLGNILDDIEILLLKYRTKK